MNAKSPILPPFLQEKLPAICELCKQHKVKTLWVFGSVVREDFSASSDVDLLYEMDEARIGPEERYDCFWGFYDALRRLLGREIDLVWYNGIRNPYFREEIDETKVLVYDASSEKIFV